LIDYKEFSMLRENAEEAGISWKGTPKVERKFFTSSEGFSISGIFWGEEPPQLVFLHGGAQNAHTWDTVALALDMPLLALDLPGHGHSDWRPKCDYTPFVLADQVAEAIKHWAPETEAVVGMSLGGLTALCIAADYPQLVKRLGIVDVTPGTDQAKAEPIINFVAGPEVFESFEEILKRTIEHNPTRSETSLRRGVLHNAHEIEDGKWSWRYDVGRAWKDKNNENASEAIDFSELWNKVAEIKSPLHLWLGGAWSVVGDEDVQKMKSFQQEIVVKKVEGAGHSIQGDKPLELKELIQNLLDSKIVN
tara:strand:+ start:5127 stop:6044 length:918 start_codon:yes stop_codon:yes gene_type:complete